MDDALAAVLRGELVRWPFADREAARFLEAAARHAVRPLIARQLRRGFLIGAPPAVEEGLKRAAVQQAAAEQRMAEEVRRVLEALARGGIPSLLMKGTALAYTHYPHPCLRPRSDTDVMVRRDDAAAAAEVFGRLGYVPLIMTGGDLVLHQQTYTRSDRLGIRHVFDVHWKLAAPQIVADLLTWEELERAATPVAPLGPDARALGDAHALLLACVHRIAHHFDDDSLIWLYDIHLVASRLADSETGWSEFMRAASNAAAASMCARSLARAYERFRTPLPDGVLTELHARGGDTADWFDARTRMIDVLALDLKATRGWRDRFRLLRQHVLPPAAYIRRRYGTSSSILLPVLYAHRCVTGVRRWLLPVSR